MEGSRGQPSLELGVRIVRVAGLDPAMDQLVGDSISGALFVRYYVPAGDGRRRLRVDTREVTPSPFGGGVQDTCHWGELARFERWGPAAPAGGVIAFELRWRPRRPSTGIAAALLGAAGARRRPSSRVLARAELAWPDHGAAAAAAAERWLTLAPVGRELGGCKAPRLLVEVDAVGAVVVAGGGGKRVRRPGAGGMRECCGAGERCGQCGWVGNEEDVFLAAAFAQ